MDKMYGLLKEVFIPIIGTSVAYVICRKIDKIVRKKEEASSAPKILIHPIKNTTALLSYIEKLKNYKKIFYLTYDIKKDIDSEKLKKDFSKIKFTSISKDEIINDNHTFPFVFIGIKCKNEREEGISLYRIIDKENKKHDIDASIVPITLESEDSYGFFCSIPDTPTKIEGAYYDTSGYYSIKHLNGSFIKFKKNKL